MVQQRVVPKRGSPNGRAQLRATAMPQRLAPEDLLSVEKGREFIIIAGKDGVGKTCALISIARVVAGLVDEPARYPIFNPDAMIYVLDTEHKFANMYRQFGAEAPLNIAYYYCQDMDEILLAFEQIMAEIKPGDWVMADSMARFWEMAQDLGYESVAGLSKAKFMERRRETGSKTVVPQPDNFWNIVKSAHDRHFLNVLIGRDDINVAMTTILVRPPREVPNRRENIDRKELREEFGIDSGLGGAPTVPYQPETLVLLDRDKGKVKAIVLRDNLCTKDDPRIQFWVDSKKTFGIDWMENCRVAEEGE